MSFFVWTTFGLLTGAIPRIGGDYTINSRVLPPWLALGGNIGSFMGGIFGVPIFGYFMATFALSPALAVIGGVTGSDTVTKWSTYFAADHKTVVFITTLAIVAIMSVLAYLGTRLVHEGVHLAGDHRRHRLLHRPADPAVHEPRLASCATSTPSRARVPTTRPWPPATRRCIPSKSGYDTHNTIGAVYYALTITIYIYWGAYLSAEFKGGGQRRRQLTAMWTAGIGNALRPADRDRDLHGHGRLRLLRLGLQRQLRGAGVERDRQCRLRVLLEPGGEQQRCW